MAVETVANSQFVLNVSIDNGTTFKKIPHLQQSDVPNNERLTDDITATDDVSEVIVPVNFTKNGEIEFEYVLDPTDAVHTSLQTLYDTNGTAIWQLKYADPKVKGYEFKGMLKKLSEQADKTKKLRVKATLLSTGTITKKLITP